VNDCATSTPFWRFNGVFMSYYFCRILAGYRFAQHRFAFIFAFILFSLLFVWRAFYSGYFVLFLFHFNMFVYIFSLLFIFCLLLNRVTSSKNFESDRRPFIRTWPELSMNCFRVPIHIFTFPFKPLFLSLLSFPSSSLYQVNFVFAMRMLATLRVRPLEVQ
jgi:hypothetical protein